MPSIPGSVPVTGFVAPTDSADTFPSHVDVYGKGGHRSVDDLTARDAITTERRVEGMTCYAESNDTTYKLQGGTANSNWKAILIGNGFPMFTANTVAEMRTISSSQFNKTCLLLGETAAFDGYANGIYAAVLDPTEAAIDDGISAIVPTDISSVATADKMYWRKP